MLHKAWEKQVIKKNLKQYNVTNISSTMIKNLGRNYQPIDVEHEVLD